MAIYMKVDGIEGDVTESKHGKWIKVDSFNFAEHRPIETAPGKVGNRASSRPTFANVNISKSVDKASTGLFTWATTGGGKKVQIHFCKEDGNTDLEFTLESVIPSMYSISGNATDVEEELSLDYTKIDMRFIPYDENNKAGTPAAVGYDLEKVQAS